MKTTVTRTLLDYYEAKKVPTKAYDTEAPRGTLKRFHPDVTEVVDIASIPDQMRVFDTLKPSDVTLIDIRAGLLSSTLNVLQDIGFIEAARKGQVSLGVFHILGPSISSLNEIGEVARFVSGTNYFLVKNMINNTAYFEWDPATYDSYFKKTKGAHQVTIPHLNEMACDKSSSHPFRLRRSSATRKRVENPLPIPSCYEVMYDIGSIMFGVNMTGSSLMR